MVVEVRSAGEDEIGLIECHIDFDWAAIGKHRERIVRQQAGEVVYLLAWRGSLPIGHVLIEWDGPKDAPILRQLRSCPDMQDLFVAPGHRSRGVGSALLDTAEVLARQQGYSRIGLGVAVDNPRARSLYERRGYEDAGFVEYTTGGLYVDRDGQQRQWHEVCTYLVKPLRTGSAGLAGATH